MQMLYKLLTNVPLNMLMNSVISSKASKETISSVSCLSPHGWGLCGSSELYSFWVTYSI